MGTYVIGASYHEENWQFSLLVEPSTLKMSFAKNVISVFECILRTLHDRVHETHYTDQTLKKISSIL